VVNADHEDRIEGLLSMVDICAYVVKLFDTDPSRKSVKFDTLFEDALRGSTAGELYSMVRWKFMTYLQIIPK
jgi:hypothetical protein